MVNLEERLVSGITGGRIIKWTLVGGACGIGPLLLYVLLGPADGNPVGLGLLAIVTVPLVIAGLAVGMVKLLVELITGQ